MKRCQVCKEKYEEGYKIKEPPHNIEHLREDIINLSLCKSCRRFSAGIQECPCGKYYIGNSPKCQHCIDEGIDWYNL